MSPLLINIVMIIVETGAGLPNSNAYADVATADTYCADRLISAWGEATVSKRASVLIRATDYIDANYRFRSVPLTDEQALAHPRDDERLTLHPVLVKATIELAIQLLSTDPFAAVSERDVIESEDTLEGVGSQRKRYADTQISDPFPEITKMLKGMKATRGGGSASTMMLTL